MAKTKKTSKKLKAKVTATAKKNKLRNPKNVIKKHKWNKNKKNGGKGTLEAIDESSLPVSTKTAPPKVGTPTGQRESHVNTLEARMTKQLQTARFRQINQALDSGTGTSAGAFNTEEDFKKYHEVYNKIRQKWTVNPCEEIIKIIEDKVEGSTGETVVADFGCGEGDIEKALTRQMVRVHCLDFFKLHPKTIVCNMNKVPLADNSVHIAVFCLSLMATDVSEFIQEANRVLIPGGLLIIAEVQSRLGGVEKFSKDLRGFGFARSDTDKYPHSTTNNMFAILNFKKVKGIRSDKTRLPRLQMKPCLYKKR